MWDLKFSLRRLWSMPSSGIYKSSVRTSQETNYVSATEYSRLKLCKIWGFHGDDYEECRRLGYRNRVHTSQETHYVSATKSSQLMLCKIWGFHGGDYEECRLLGYKNQIHTSQEAHYVSATEFSRLMLWKIWGFHGGDYEECGFLGCPSCSSLQEPHGVTSQKTAFFHSFLFLKLVIINTEPLS
jgi:hypothetical protein